MSTVNVLRAGRASVVAVCWLIQATLAAAQTVAPLSLRIDDEVVAPGGVLQAKLVLTEPRPITTGGGSMSFGRYDDYLGFAVHSASGDAAAVGVIRGGTLRVRMVSPTSGIGAEGEYPILTTTLRVPSTEVPGTRSLLDMTGTTFVGPTGAYEYELKPGEAVVEHVASITDVSPGSAFVPAGSPIVITGLGFERGMRVRLGETEISSVRVESPTRIVVTPGEGVTMHGMDVRIEIPSTRQRATYYAYQRTTALDPSTHALFAAVEVAFPRLSSTLASVTFPAVPVGDLYGVALQNERPVASTVTLSLLTGGSVDIALPAYTRAVRSLGELFGSACAAGCRLDVVATSPVQVLGLAGDVPTDTVTPLFPGEGTPPPPATLSLMASTNTDTLHVGEPLVVTAHVTPGPVPVTADAYFLLYDESERYRSITPAGLRSGLKPYARKMVVSAPMTLEVFRTTGLAAGVYRIESRLVASGTRSVLTTHSITVAVVDP